MEFEAKIDRTYEKLENKITDIMKEYFEKLCGILMNPEMTEEEETEIGSIVLKRKEGKKNKRDFYKNENGKTEKSMLQDGKTKKREKGFRAQQKEGKQQSLKKEKKFFFATQRYQRQREEREQCKDGFRKTGNRTRRKKQRIGKKWKEKLFLKFGRKIGLKSRDNG